MYNSVLVPLDGSAHAEEALPIAARLARSAGGTVVLIHVMRHAAKSLTPFTPATGAPREQAAAGGGARHLGSAKCGPDDHSVRSYLAHVAAQPAFSGLQVKTRVLTGPTFEAIIEAVDSAEASLVVMCARHHTGLRHLLFGGITERVVHASHVPVLLVRDGVLAVAQSASSGGGSELGSRRPLRVLVPLDGSMFGESALAPAAGLALALQKGHQRAKLHLVVALPPDEADPAHLPHGLAHVGARSYLARIAGQLEARYPLLDVTWSVVPGVCATQALQRVLSGRGTTEAADTANEARGTPYAYDLIAMATHGHTRFYRWELGSIAERIMHSTTLPILLARPAREVTASPLPQTELPPV